MCGIIAASSPTPLNRNDVKLGLLLAEDRGKHSTGFYDGQKILRTTSDVKGFLTKDKKTIPLPEQVNYFIGHTRHATQGECNLANSHPFNLTNMVGIHNGSVDNFDELNKTYGEKALSYVKSLNKNRKYIQDLEEVSSDSMLMYYLISKHGLKETLPQLKGTMALMWIDSSKRMHVYRWDKPLCYGYKGEQMWIGSLKKYLDGLGCSKIKSFTEHSHYIIEHGKITQSKQLKKKLQPQKKDSSRKDDIDPDLPVKKVPVKQKQQLPDKQEEEESAPFETHLFKAPVSAEVEYSGSNLVLWWFSETDYNVVYVELEGFEDIMCYDLSKENDRAIFKDDNPEIMESVMAKHENLEFANELRRQHEQQKVSS